MIKGMPIDESQINTQNLGSFTNIPMIFNKYNVDLMFTLSSINVKIEIRKKN